MTLSPGVTWVIDQVAHEDSTAAHGVSSIPRAAPSHNVRRTDVGDKKERGRGYDAVTAIPNNEGAIDDETIENECDGDVGRALC